MNRVWIVYDDSNPPEDDIRAIVGSRRFGEILIGKQPVQERMRALFSSALPEGAILALDCKDAIASLSERIAAQQSREAGRTRVLHFFSDFLFQRREVAELVIRSAAFAERIYTAKQDGRGVFYAFPSVEVYLRFLQRAEETGGTRLPTLDESTGDIRLNGDEFLYIGAQEGLVLSLTSKYDARYFNHLSSEADIVTKTSANIEKLRAEFRFWQLLPDAMKMWFVMPFDFQEDGTSASYRMERLYLPNLAVKFVHGAMDDEEFESFLLRYFRFLGARARRTVSKEAYAARAERLYVCKTRDRLGELKNDPRFGPVAALIRTGTAFGDVDAAFERYCGIYARITARSKPMLCEVIGHGDACLSNILFDRASKTLKLIDPKGVTAEEELWTDPYYDLCKLTHSVLGLYDFFNSGLYELSLDEALRFRLVVPFDNARYATALRAHMAANGFDEATTRVGEAGLFLSMLPLHIDNPHKVLGFFLNAMRILDELEHKMQGDR